MFQAASCAHAGAMHVRKHPCICCTAVRAHVHKYTPQQVPPPCCRTCSLSGTATACKSYIPDAVVKVVPPTCPRKTYVAVTYAGYLGPNLKTLAFLVLPVPLLLWPLVSLLYGLLAGAYCWTVLRTSYAVDACMQYAAHVLA